MRENEREDGKRIEKGGAYMFDIRGTICQSLSGFRNL